MKLRLADDLSLPLDVVTQTIVVLAKRRVGKSYTMRRLVEQLMKANQQVVLVDPKGDQWGLRSAANGKDPGLSIVILGGERGDVPLEAGAGEVVAKLVVEERVSALLDLSLFRKHEVATFMTGFMEALYRLKAREIYRTPMMLVIDEADAVAPQKPQKGEERMLGAAEDIVRRGGQRGIGCVLVSQRSAVLNKNVLTQAQILVVLRTIAPQDLAAMKAWIDVHGDEDQGKELMGSLPSLPVGDAWVWSPGWPTTKGIFQRVHVLPIETFDSGKSPDPNEKKRAEPKHLADVDLEALKRQMASTIEKAKADDPRELRKVNAEKDKRIKELEAALSKPVHKMHEKQTKRVEVLTDADRALLGELFLSLRSEVDKFSGEGDRSFAVLQQKAETAVVAALTRLRADLADIVVKRHEQFAKRLEMAGFQKILAKLEAMSPEPSRSVAQSRNLITPGQIVHTRTISQSGTKDTPPVRLESNSDGTLTKMQRTMLIALAQHPNGLTKKQLLIHSSYSSNGNTSATFAEFVREGWADAPVAGSLRITQKGLEVLGPYEPLPVGDALRQELLLGDRLSEMERRILAAICAPYPDDVAKGEILGAAKYSSNGNTSATFAKLVALGYAVRGTAPGRLKAADELFG
jgi:hypothetical protein